MSVPGSVLGTWDVSGDLERQSLATVDAQSVLGAANKTAGGCVTV